VADGSGSVARMEPHGDRNDMPALASASVILLRDGAAGLEVFLVKRHGLSDVLGGAHVFPGGKVDREDVELVGRLDRSADELHAALGEPDLQEVDAAALHVAAIRELLEETGVLFAHVAPATAASVWRQLREGPRFGELAAELDLQLATTGLAPWSRWITPLVGGVVRKRFDTRFFVAALPEGQAATHDDHEATDSLWASPREALERYWAGELQFAPPQVMSLVQLARHADVAGVLADASSRRPPRVLPEALLAADGARVVCYPGDPAHSVQERALPGPTRLVWRNQRFEPDAGGLAALIG
jgi:8-oxo-dGTP pyrophosphatase MutT (NUDIX family)